MQRLIECVPNFSEGRDRGVIDAIVGAISAVEGVTVLDVDPGASTNRTVVTFVGEPEAVVAAAFAGIRTAAEVIDMRVHRGEHPRMGATDVCPLVPVAGVTMEETVEYARRLAQRVGEELDIPVYLYEEAATRPERRNLARIRSGEYEGLARKLQDPEWQPDFGPASFNSRAGATVIGARDFLIAYNVNLNTTSTRRANAVAFDVRERGRIKRTGDPLTGEVVLDAEGNPVRIPGALEGVKAVGWYIEEYGICQVSMNLTDIRATPLHLAFEEVSERAEARGMRVTGSQIVGLLPLRILRAAGEYFLRKQQRSLGIPEREIVEIAIRSLGLNELAPFEPEQRVIEYALAARTGEAERARLVDRTVTGFANAVASEAPTPGGGSVAAAVGALGAALGTMVANGSAHKRGWDARWETFSDWAVKGRAIQEELLSLVDADTHAFDVLMAAYAMPRSTESEQRARAVEIVAATFGAIDAPLRTMRAALRSMEVIRAMAAEGNPNAVSDAGVGALCARTAVRGAHLNVRTNAASLDEGQAEVEELLAEAEALAREAERMEREILEIVSSKIGE
jgi:glutamate formiminotransferase / formiminotetrahydrofolate cyclodeaminase